MMHFFRSDSWCWVVVLFSQISFQRRIFDYFGSGDWSFDPSKPSLAEISWKPSRDRIFHWLLTTVAIDILRYIILSLSLQNEEKQPKSG